MAGWPWSRLSFQTTLRGTPGPQPTDADRWAPPPARGEPLAYAMVYWCRFQPWLCGMAYMQAATIVFPFKQTFRRLELERRWWHRLCVVIFFATLLCTAAFTAVAAYSVFAPQIDTMPRIETGFSDQPRVDSPADLDAIVSEADRAALPANANLPPQGFHVDGTMTLKQFGQRIKAKYPVYGDIDTGYLAFIR